MENVLLQLQHQTADIVDPFGLEVTVKIRRYDHPKAAQIRGATMQNGRTAMLHAAREASKRQFPDLKFNPGDLDESRLHELSRLDPEFQAALEQNAQQSRAMNKERQAASCVAGWQGELFTADEVPSAGAFTTNDVHEKLFSKFGGLPDSDDDVCVVPRFREVESRAYLATDSDLYAQAEELCMAYLDRLEETRKLPSATDDDFAEKVKHRATDEGRAEIKEAEEEALAKLESQLQGIGVEESPYGGSNLRAAVAQWIISEANELKSRNLGVVVPLGRKSASSNGSKGSSGKPTAKKKTRRKPRRKCT